MSGEVVTWAMYHAPMLETDAGRPDSTSRFVLAVLAEAAHRDGTDAYPSPERIQFATGFDLRVIKRALKKLHKAGLIEEDGSHLGQTRWKLATSLRRPDSDRLAQEAERDARRQAEAEYRQAYRRGVRRRPQGAVSGTENPGQEAVSGTESTGQTILEEGPVRDGESRRPGQKVPVSGTQNPGPIDKEGTALGTVPEPPNGGRRAAPQTPAPSTDSHPDHGVTDQLNPVGDPPHARAEQEPGARGPVDDPPNPESGEAETAALLEQLAEAAAQAELAEGREAFAAVQRLVALRAECRSHGVDAEAITAAENRGYQALASMPAAKVVTRTGKRRTARKRSRR